MQVSERTMARPLSELLRAAERTGKGLSYREMARRAAAGGYPMPHRRFCAYANDQVVNPPPATELEAIAAGTGQPLPVVFAAMVEQYYGRALRRERDESRHG